MEDQTTGQRGPDCFCKGAGPEATRMAEDLWSKATGDHFRNARIEILKGIRSFVDQRIDKLSRHAGAKGSTVVVE